MTNTLNTNISLQKEGDYTIDGEYVERFDVPVLDADVAAFWTDRHGECSDNRWREPCEGYVCVKIGAVVTLTLNGQDAARLLSDLKPWERGSSSATNDVWVSWDLTWTLVSHHFSVSISDRTRDQLVEALEWLCANRPVR